MAGRGPTGRLRAPITIPAKARAKKPPVLPDASSYSAATKRWYATWIKQPQASIFSGSEWSTLHMIAPLVELYHSKPSAALHAEIRVSEAKLGATREDRIRLGWFIEGEAVPIFEDEKPAPSRLRARDRLDPRLNPDI